MFTRKKVIPALGVTISSRQNRVTRPAGSPDDPSKLSQVCVSHVNESRRVTKNLVLRVARDNYSPYKQDLKEIGCVEMYLLDFLGGKTADA